MKERRFVTPLKVSLLIVVAWAAGAALVFAFSTNQRAADIETITAYEEELVPHARRAGQLIELEIKPSITGLRDGSIPAEDIVRRSADWVEAFEDVRAKFLAADAPDFLVGIEELWDRAFEEYVTAFALFGDGARAEGANRDRVLDEGIDHAEAADDLFDEASAILQRGRRNVQLPPTSNFPDPAGRETEGLDEHEEH